MYNLIMSFTSDKDYVFNIKNYKQKGEYIELATNMYYPSQYYEKNEKENNFFKNIFFYSGKEIINNPYEPILGQTY